jgi:hypothetical protein
VQFVEVAREIPGPGKAGHPVDAALHQVLGNAGEVESRCAGHGQGGGLGAPKISGGGSCAIGWIPEWLSAIAAPAVSIRKKMNPVPLFLLR